MIRINNLNKSFKTKGAKIHVINNTSLELPNNGLITLLGESGSGKTTLLNVIGGLDDFSDGSIEFDDYTAKKYSMKNMDKYRNNNISYIFQNYYLINSLSVYDNLKEALRIIGIEDKEEIDKRIKIALEAVKMYKYRKKKVDALSGGQQQRIAIARALIKKNKLIIADEPTGNLDSENSINIMNILKEISKTNLVLLVTHNKNLANYFSDYIYNIRDGSIVDGFKPISTELNIEDNTIYLKDLNKTSCDLNEESSVNFYNKQEGKVDLDLIFINGSYYIRSNKPIKLLSESNLKVLDASKQEIKKNEIHVDYNNDDFNNVKTSSRLKTFFSALENSFKNYNTSKKKVKFFRFSLFLIGAVCSILTILLFKNTYKDYKELKYAPKNVYINYNPAKAKLVNNDIYSTTLLDEYYDGHITKFCNLNKTVYLELFENKYIKNKNAPSLLLDLSFNSSKVLYGTDKLTNAQSILISKAVADNIRSNVPYEKLIGRSVKSSGYGNLIITGIVDSDRYETFIDTSIYNYDLGNYFYEIMNIPGSNKTYTICIYDSNSNFLKENLEFTSGKASTESFAYIQSEGCDTTTIGKYFKSSGQAIFKPNNGKTNPFLIIMSDKQYNKLENMIIDNPYICGFSISDTADVEHMQYIPYADYIKTNIDSEFNSSHETLLITISVLLGLMILYIYFTEHSKLINNIKEIGILRAIGKSRTRIALSFATDAFVESILTVLIGYLSVGFIVGFIENMIRSNLDNKYTLFYENPMFYLMYLLIILIFVVFGSLPSIILMRRTPSEIIAKYDI